jgi:RNA polymerase sigma-70 factor (ECF subfamily)
MSNPAFLAAKPPLCSSLFDSADLYRAHAPRVARWVAQLGGGDVDVDDATQEVFLVAHRERASFRGEAQVTTWLYRITLNVVRHLRRKQLRRQWLAGSASDVAGHLQAPGPTPVDAFEKRRSAEQLRRALLRLQARDRAIIIMFEIEGLSGHEIAERTAVKPATVWVRLHRARAELLRQLRESEDQAWPSGTRRAPSARPPSYARASMRGCLLTAPRARTGRLTPQERRPGRAANHSTGRSCSNSSRATAPTPKTHIGKCARG